MANADLDIEGISIGAKYSFLNKKFKFAAMKNLKKSDPNFEVDHEFEISYDHNENDNIKLKYEDKTFGTELECDIWSSENKNHRLGLYKNTKIGSDFSLATTLQLLYGFGSNYFFHFGLRKLGLFGNESDEVCKLRQPNFSFGGLYRFVKNDNLDGSVGLNVDLKQTSVEKVRPMLSLRSGNFATLLNLSLEPLSGSYKTGADLGIETQVSDDLNVYGHFKVDHTPAQGKEDAVLSNEFTVGAAYRFDKATELRLSLRHI